MRRIFASTLFVAACGGSQRPAAAPQQAPEPSAREIWDDACPVSAVDGLCLGVEPDELATHCGGGYRRVVIHPRDADGAARAQTRFRALPDEAEAAYYLAEPTVEALFALQAPGGL